MKAPLVVQVGHITLTLVRGKQQHAVILHPHGAHGLVEIYGDGVRENALSLHNGDNLAASRQQVEESDTVKISRPGLGTTVAERSIKNVEVTDSADVAGLWLALRCTGLVRAVKSAWGNDGATGRFKQVTTATELAAFLQQELLRDGVEARPMTAAA